MEQPVDPSPTNPESVAWAAIGLIVRRGGGAVSERDLDEVWEVITAGLEARGLQLSATRLVPLSQQELESRDLLAILKRRAEGAERPI